MRLEDYFEQDGKTQSVFWGIWDENFHVDECLGTVWTGLHCEQNSLLHKPV